MAIGVRFRDFAPDENSGDKGFEQLFKLFMQLITITSGDVGEALQWLNELDKQYGMTDNDYGMGNFIEDLKKKGYIDENEQERGELKITPKTEPENPQVGAGRNIWQAQKKQHRQPPHAPHRAGRRAEHRPARVSLRRLAGADSDD